MKHIKADEHLYLYDGSRDKLSEVIPGMEGVSPGVLPKTPRDSRIAHIGMGALCTIVGVLMGVAITLLALSR